MANPYAPPSVDENPSLGELPDYRPTQALSLAVRVLLGLTIVVLVLGLGHGYLQLDLFGRIKQGRNFTVAEAEASDLQAAMQAGLYLLVLLATVITWIVWQTRTSKNARALGAEYMEFGPNAWGWFFCPFINLFRPLAVVQELWRVNDPKSSHEAPSYFLLWWIPWVIGSILGNVSARMADEDADVDELILSIQLDMAAGVFLIVAGIFAIKVVAEIHRREQARARTTLVRSRP
jgi:heme/copper-type cytochrome/quinol oxidase subunit 2